MTSTTYAFQCPCCGKIESDRPSQAYVVIMPKDGGRPRDYEICSECRKDMYDLLEGRIEQRIAQEKEEHIPVSLWGHHE